MDGWSDDADAAADDSDDDDDGNCAFGSVHA